MAQQAARTTRIPIHQVNLSVCLVGLVLIVGPACDESDQKTIHDEYLASRETSNWVVEYVVNGEPACRVDGTAVGQFDVTQFVANGRNTVSITAKCAGSELNPSDHSGMELLRCTHRDGRFTFTTLGGIREKVTPPCADLDADFEFEADVPVRWRWQDADVVTNLSNEDRAKIQASIREFVSAIRARAWEQVRKQTVPWWKDERAVPALGDPSIQDRVREQLIERVSRFADFGVFVPDEQNITLAVGRRIVRVAPSARSQVFAEPLISIGHQGHVNRLSEDNIQIPALYFIRENGEWLMMLPTWKSSTGSL